MPAATTVRYFDGDAFSERDFGEDGKPLGEDRVVKTLTPLEASAHHRASLAAYEAREIARAAAPVTCWHCPEQATHLHAHFGDYVPTCDGCDPESATA